MTRLSVIAAVSIGLATAGAWAASSYADPGLGAPVTVERTVTERVTVPARSRGRTASQWHQRTLTWRTRAHRAEHANRQRARVIRAQQRELAAQARDYRDDFGIRTSGFLCIHRYEGSWTAATGNGYYGGVQMDRSFMGTYGGPFLRAYGTADHWPAYIQIAVAEYARLSGRGYAPWPNTARACGLL